MKPVSRSVQHLRWLALPAALIILPAAAEQVDWELRPTVGLSQIYSDNIALAPSGERDDDFVTQLKAGLELSARTLRFRGLLDYNLLGLVYWDNSDFNDVFHQGNGALRFDAVPDRFFIDASTRYYQRLRSRAGTGGDIINVGVDRTDVWEFGISPTYLHRFQNWADLRASYAYDRIDYEVSELREIDSQSHRFMVDLTSGSAFSTFGWELSFDREETDFDDGSSVTFQTAEALGRWNVTDRFSAFAAVGDENNSFEQDPPRARPSDTFWRVGGTFQPGPRTFLEAFVGERYFGTTFGLDFEHRIRDGRLFAGYSEELATVGRGRRGQLIDDDGLPVFDPGTGDPIFEEPDLLVGAFLRKRFEAGAALARPRTQATFRFYNQRREFERTSRRESSFGLVVNADWQASPRMKVYGDARYEETDFADIVDRDDSLFSLRMGISRELARRTSASVDYRFTYRDSTDGRFDYRENRLTATVTHRF